MQFKEFFANYLIINEEFKKSSKYQHYMDLPMFSLFFEKKHKTIFFQNLPHDDDLKKIFAEARNTIIKMGFSSMHVNVLFRDMSDRINKNTGGSSGGYASSNGKYMAVDIIAFNNPSYLKTIIIHEWAHLWMFNNSNGFKKAVKEYYESLLNKGKQEFNSLLNKGKQEFNIPDDITDNNITTFLHPLIDNKQDNHLFTIYILEFANLIAQAYYEFLDTKLRYVGLDDELKKLMRNHDRDELPDKKTIYSSTERMIRKMIEYYNNNVEHYDLRIYDNRFKKELNTLIKTIGDSIIEDRIFDYVKRSIENDLSEYYEKIGHSYLFDGELSEKQLEDFHLSLYNRTNNNKFILKQKNDSYDHINSIVDTYPKEDPHDYYDLIMYHLKRMKSSLAIGREFSLSVRSINLTGQHFNKIRPVLSKLVQWSDAYGMSNHLELWATGIEEFIKLPIHHRKKIMELMTKQDRREKPNRTMRAKLNK